VHVRARKAQGSIFEDVTVAKDARHVFISTHNGITQANKVIPRNGATVGPIQKRQNGRSFTPIITF
jgi:hypothetical protein